MKKFMLFIVITTIVSYASQEPIQTEFTVTQIALDAANEKEALEAFDDQNTSIKEIQSKGGDAEEK